MENAPEDAAWPVEATEEQLLLRSAAAQEGIRLLDLHVERIMEERYSRECRSMEKYVVALVRDRLLVARVTPEQCAKTWVWILIAIFSLH
jgi:hypothetical protein